MHLKLLSPEIPCDLSVRRSLAGDAHSKVASRSIGRSEKVGTRAFQTLVRTQSCRSAINHGMCDQILINQSNLLLKDVPGSTVKELSSVWATEQQAT